MEINEFCEKILGIKLNDFQKENLEKYGDKKICVCFERHSRFGKNYFTKFMQEKINELRS